MKSSARSRYAGQFRGIREGVRGDRFSGEPAEWLLLAPLIRADGYP
jgi:hypothetical protein